MDSNLKDILTEDNFASNKNKIYCRVMHILQHTLQENEERNEMQQLALKCRSFTKKQLKQIRNSKQEEFEEIEYYYSEDEDCF